MMLVLTRKEGQKVVIGDNVVVTVLSIQGNTAKLGFEAPVEVPIHREELRRHIENECRGLGDPPPSHESRFFVEFA
jgi:carbon storage regulator